MDLLNRIEAALAENAESRSRLTREAALLREAATRLRTGAPEGPVAAQLWADGLDPSDLPARAGARRT